MDHELRQKTGLDTIQTIIQRAGHDGPIPHVDLSRSIKITCLAEMFSIFFIFNKNHGLVHLLLLSPTLTTDDALGALPIYNTSEGNMIIDKI